jgi:hypothetical protein
MTSFRIQNFAAAGRTGQDRPISHLSRAGILRAFTAPANDFDVVEGVAATTGFWNPVIATWRAPIVAPVEVAHGNSVIGTGSTEILIEVTTPKQATLATLDAPSE